jgi:hypothetical protein
MCMLDHRVQILLDDERYQKVAHEAAARGVSIAAIIREAIDQIPVADAQRRAAIAAILDAPAMPVPSDPADLRREREDARSRSLT